MKYREVVRMGEEFLFGADIADARTDAWLLLAWICRMDRSFYYLHMEDEFPAEQLSEYRNALEKRAEHVPLQYIVGETEFMGMRFKVNSNVLIPRQDTETLVAEALRVVKPGMRVLDLCTGSGCIIISILRSVMDVEGHAVDISKQALAVAKENARLNGVSVFFEQSNLFERVKGTFHVIVSNPPYIRSAEIMELMPEVRDFEPLVALDGSEDGLAFYREITQKGRDYLTPGGQIFFEIGCEQGEAVTSLMEKAGFREIRTVRDLSGHDRVVTGML